MSDCGESNLFIAASIIILWALISYLAAWSGNKIHTGVTKTESEGGWNGEINQTLHFRLQKCMHSSSLYLAFKSRGQNAARTYAQFVILPVTHSHTHKKCIWEFHQRFGSWVVDFMQLVSKTGNAAFAYRLSFFGRGARVSIDKRPRLRSKTSVQHLFSGLDSDQNIRAAFFNRASGFTCVCI